MNVAHKTLQLFTCALNPEVINYIRRCDTALHERRTEGLNSSSFLRRVFDFGCMKMCSHWPRATRRLPLATGKMSPAGARRKVVSFGAKKCQKVLKGDIWMAQ